MKMIKQYDSQPFGRNVSHIRHFVMTMVCGVFMLAGCGDFGDTNIDPNKPAQPDTRFLYIGAVRQALPSFYVNDLWNPWTLIYPQYVAEKNNIQFTTFEQLTFDISEYYTVAIRNLELIISLNSDEDTRNESYVTAFGASNANQIAAARTLLAYIYMHLTDALGMIPYSEVNLGERGLFMPVFDSQESIYKRLNSELEESWEQFDESQPLDPEYEILYAGDIGKWKRFNASVRMQLAIKLCRVDPANGKARFARAYAQGFIRSNKDILQFNYLDEADNQNPLYENIVATGRRDYWPSATIVDTMKVYDDPRLPAYFTEVRTGGFAGMPFGLPPAEAAVIDASTLSYWNDRFYKQDAPAVLITPSIILLAAAEAAEYGWINASAKELYDEAITASLTQHGVEHAVDDYLAHPAVAYRTHESVEQRISQIAIQKWIASFLQDGIETWSDYRRLGRPALTTGALAHLEAIPRRCVYDVAIYDANRDNYNNAIVAQGPDLPATRLWWDVINSN